MDALTRRIALLVAGCFFLENLDATIVTTAAPAISSSLGVPASSVGLVVTAYLLSLAVLLPVSGWLATRWGPRRVLVAAITVFTLASLACALSRSLPELVALRVVQGAGGAMMVPVGRLVVLGRTDRSQLVRVIAWLTWPGLVAPVIAPLVGGVLVTVTSWRSIFAVNVPLGAVAVVAALRLVPPRGDGSGAAASGADVPARPPLDRLGVLLTGAALGGAAWTTHLVADAALGGATAVWALASVAAVAAALAHLRRTPHPLVDLAPLRGSVLRLALGGMSVHWLVVGAVPFLLPLLFQEVFGWSPVLSGAVVLCVFAGNVAVKPATTPLLRRFGFKGVLLGASAGVAVAVAGLGFVREATPLLVVALLCAASGVVRSVGFTAYGTIALADVAPADVPSANTLFVTVQQMGAAFAIAGATLGLRLGSAATGGGAHQVGPYAVTLWLLAALELVALGIAARLPAGAGDDVRRGAEPVRGPARGAARRAASSAGPGAPAGPG